VDEFLLAFLLPSNDKQNLKEPKNMFDPKPSTWLGPGYDSDATAHTVTMNTGSAPSNKTLLQLTDAKADPDTGDIRSVAFGFLEALFQAWKSQGPTSQPARMTVNRSVSADSNAEMTLSYSVKFTIGTDGVFAVVDE